MLAFGLVAPLYVGCANTPSAEGGQQAATDLAQSDAAIPEEWRSGEVRRVASDAEGHWFVMIELPDPLPNDAWPLDMCDMLTPDTFEAVAWQISTDGDEILARSPVWADGLSCIQLPASPD